MNASSQRRFSKGAIFNTKHTAPSVARVFEAACLSRFFTVRCTGKVGSLAAQQRGSLFGFRFLRGNGAKSSLTDLLSRFGRHTVVTYYPGMTLTKVLFGGKAFEIFRSVVRFNPIDVMNLFCGVKQIQPASRNNAVHEVVSPAEGEITIGTQGRCVRLELSENFSAARDCKKVVEESILDSVYLDAYHAVPLCS